MFGIGIPTVPEIDAKEVYDNLQGKKGIALVDVRTAQEYRRGSIEGSINIPLQELSEKIESKISDKNKTVYVYCLSGSRSIVAVDQMIKMGYKNVFSMKSGLLAWRANQLPLQQNS
jgi:rhodanese-related sulfurtransferase